MMVKLNKIKTVYMLALGAVACVGLASSASAHVDLGISLNVRFAPPSLPIYDQPRIPGYGYIWTPGYWAWYDECRNQYNDYYDNYDNYYDECQGYYWVPGTWVRPPRIGLLWTPGYWVWNTGSFRWSLGYWGQEVGYYGGIYYGFGYTGSGYDGGYWRGGNLYYNSYANNLDRAQINYIYNQTIIDQRTINYISYNGGPGGVTVTPTSAQLQFAQANHVKPTTDQRKHELSAKDYPELRAANNNGRPPIAATESVVKKPADFKASVVVPTKEARQYTPKIVKGEKLVPLEKGDSRKANSRSEREAKKQMREAQPSTRSDDAPPSTVSDGVRQNKSKRQRNQEMREPPAARENDAPPSTFDDRVRQNRSKRQRNQEMREPSSARENDAPPSTFGDNVRQNRPERQRNQEMREPPAQRENAAPPSSFKTQARPDRERPDWAESQGRQEARSNANVQQPEKKANKKAKKRGDRDEE